MAARKKRARKSADSEGVEQTSVRLGKTTLARVDALVEKIGFSGITRIGLLRDLVEAGLVVYEAHYGGNAPSPKISSREILAVHHRTSKAKTSTRGGTSGQESDD